MCKNNQSTSACIIAAASRRKRVWEKTKICVFVWVYVRDSEIEDRGKHLCTRLWKTGRVKTRAAKPTWRQSKTNKQAEGTLTEAPGRRDWEGGVRSKTGYWIYTTPPCCQITLDFDVAPINKGCVDSGWERSWWQIEHTVGIKLTTKYNSCDLHLR